jgi:hypothetical protein
MSTSLSCADNKPLALHTPQSPVFVLIGIGVMFYISAKNHLPAVFHQPCAKITTLKGINSLVTYLRAALRSAFPRLLGHPVERLVDVGVVTFYYLEARYLFA